MTGLKLNDRLIIRDKRYIINEMNSELTSGVVNFTLINDFRPVQRTKPGKGDKGKDLGYSVVRVDLLLPNRALSIDIDITATDIISVDYTTVYEDTTVTFILPEVPSKYNRVTEDGLSNRITENTTQRINEEVTTVPYNVKLTYNFDNDITEIDYLLITQ